MEKLHEIKERLLKVDATAIRSGLLTALEIKGLGTAGASGLLALMYPAAFATVDQFVVLALREITDLSDAAALTKMKPLALTVPNGVKLIEIMSRKACQLNQRFNIKTWTPRRIDQVLWTCGR